MPYRISGTYFENCDCDVACPCGASNLLLPATNERCHFLMAVDIASGQVDGLDVAGMRVVLLGDTPGQMTDGGWRMGLFLDDRATDAQREALAAVFSGRLGGPPAMLEGFVGELLGVEVARIDIEEEGRRHRVRVGGEIDVEIEEFAAAEEGQVMRLVGVGHPMNSTLSLGQATRSHVAAWGIEMAAAGKNAHAAPFEWAAG